MAKSWMVAPALVTLLEQVNLKFPGRRKDSDGTIGNAEHSSRESDHNPNSHGVVCALDITHDPLHGLNSEMLAEALRRAADSRVQYIISNRKIANFDKNNGAWRPYGGANPHDHHCHISLRQESRFYDDGRKWNLDVTVQPPASTVLYVPPPPKLQISSQGGAVVELQRLLGMNEADGRFGPKTKSAVKEFQKAHDLLDDGIVGPATWAALRGVKNA